MRADNERDYGVDMRHIIATSGGFTQTDRWGVVKPAATLLRALELTGEQRPKLLFVMTASGDNDSYLRTSYAAMSGYSCDVAHLSLFTMPNRPVAEAVEWADVIWVGGGSVANLLALWRLHGVDQAMRAAWESGTVLAGVSAGSICWHVGGTTDSFGPDLQLVDNGLGFLPYGNGVHYDSEPQRRPLLHQMVAEGRLPLSFATDDKVGIHYNGTDPVEVICDLPPGPDQPGAYRVELDRGEIVETRLVTGRL